MIKGSTYNRDRGIIQNNDNKCNKTNKMIGLYVNKSELNRSEIILFV